MKNKAQEVLKHIKQKRSVNKDDLHKMLELSK